MEDPGSKMEEIYALLPRLKYTESWLEIKEKKVVLNFKIITVR